MNPQNYLDEVMDYMEYIGVPDYVVAYEPIDLAKSYSYGIGVMYLCHISPRMAALTMFGLTLEKIVSTEVKH